MNFNKFLNL